MPRKTHDDVLQNHLADPTVAAAYLNSAFESGDAEHIADAWNAVMRASGNSTIPTMIGEVGRLQEPLAAAHLRLRFEAAPMQRVASK
jgi:DNA-binding phage protein